MSTVKKMAAAMMSAVLLASSAACGEFAKTHELSKQSFVDDYGYSEEYWPWSADDTTVECKDHNAVVMTIDGTTYPLNGMAKDWKYANGDLNNVWKDNPDVDGLKVDISDYNHIALGFCGIDSPSLHDSTN